MNVSDILNLKFFEKFILFWNLGFMKPFTIILFRCVLASLYEVVSVRRSVGRMVRRMVTRFFAVNEPFSIWKSLGQSNIDIAECAWFA